MRGAQVRLGFGTAMWLFAAVALATGILAPTQVIGVTASLALLITVGFGGAVVARRLDRAELFGPLSVAVNAVEVLAHTSVIHFVGGLEAAFLAPTYCAVIAYVGVVAPPRYPYLVAGLSSFAFAGMVAIEHAGLIAHYPIGVGPPLPQLYQVWITALVVALLFMIAYLSADAAASLKAKRERLQEEKERLEARVLERTDKLATINRQLEHEVAVRREAETAARRSEERYRLLVDDISDVIYSHDVDGHLIDLSPSGVTHFGAAAAQAIGRSLTDFMPPQHAARFPSEYLDALRHAGHHEGVYVLAVGDTREHYFEYRSRLVTADDGTMRVTGVARDITARVLSKRRVKALQEQLAQAQKMEAVKITRPM